MKFQKSAGTARSSDLRTPTSLSHHNIPLSFIVCLKICLLHEFKLDVCYDQEWNMDTSTTDVWASLSLFLFRSLFLSAFGLGLFSTRGTPVQHKLFTVCTSVGIVVWLVKHCVLVGVCVFLYLCVFVSAMDGAAVANSCTSQDNWHYTAGKVHISWALLLSHTQTRACIHIYTKLCTPIMTQRREGWLTIFQMMFVPLSLFFFFSLSLSLSRSLSLRVCVYAWTVMTQRRQGWRTRLQTTMAATRFANSVGANWWVHQFER